MADPGGLNSRRYTALNRLQAVLSGRARPAKGFASRPEPRTIGSHARGKQLLAGNILLAGHLVEAPTTSIWDLAIADPAFDAACHGFGWLDDLAAVADPRARSRAQDWTYGWIERFGRGRGPGWTPDLAGRRLIRWVNHALLLLNGQSPKATAGFFRSLGHQTFFLARRWRAAPAGLPRFEALTGLVYAGLALDGMGRYVIPAAAALARECAARIDAQGGIPSRNPEELLEVFSLLTWAASALNAAGKAPHKSHTEAIERIAPTLRALRHADGGLARFHGGGQGLEGRLDQALASAGVRAVATPGLAMGFARLAAGRTSVLVDAASPPSGQAALRAHASTLAFELTSGRRALIVNCGSGASFGPDWCRVGRATPSHSTLGINGYSSSRFATEAAGADAALAPLLDTPGIIRVQQAATQKGIVLVVGHDGYVGTHGLTHVRQLELNFDGRMLRGDDTLGATSDTDRKRFDTVVDAAGLGGIGFAIRFHLHPDVDAKLDLGGTAVSMALKSGEIWIFRHDGTAHLALEPSVYLESGRLKPCAAVQIVLSAKVRDHASQIGWTLAKAQDTPRAIRDTVRDEPS